MHRFITAFVASACLLGLPSTAFAQNQSTSSSPAALLGVQERSIPTRAAVSSPETSQLNRENLSKGSDPLVLYRLDSKTRVILGPVYKATDPAEIPVAGSTGDNRVQLMHDLDQ